MKKNILSQMISAAIDYKKEQFKKVQNKQKDRASRRLENEIMLIRGAQAERDKRQLEGKERISISEQNEWDTTMNILRDIDQNYELER